jgi:hypothetical protein
MTVLFRSDGAADSRYVDEVCKTNQEILREVSSNNVVTYPAKDCVMMFNMLNSFSKGITRSSRLVLCSLGPKTFGLCCFLVAAIHRDVSIWRVSAAEHEVPTDKKPEGVPLVLQTTWTGKEV